MINIQGKNIPMNIYLTRNSDLYNQVSSVLAYTSNYIENNQLSFVQTKNLIVNGTKVKLDNVGLQDVYEAINHNEAFAYMLNEINYQDDLTIDLIIDINRLINNRIINLAQLGLRTIPVEVRNTDVVTTEPHLIKEQLQSLLEKYNLLFKESVDFKDLAQFHEEFETIHPFIDGNGRTGRLLINFYLIKNQLAPTYINDTQKEQYYDCLSKKDYQQLASILEANCFDNQNLIKQYLIRDEACMPEIIEHYWQPIVDSFGNIAPNYENFYNDEGNEYDK